VTSSKELTVSDKRMLWVVLAGISLCLKVCVLVNKSSRSSHSSYSSSSSYDPYGLNAYKGSKSYPSFQGSQRSQELRAFEDALSQERLRAERPSRRGRLHGSRYGFVDA
jgi:hypothetical protein